jgi:two-component system, sensor histidine kinase and response regulator
MNYKIMTVLLTLLICLVLAVIVNVIYGIDIVYTHLFYIPIIFTGIWYPRAAVFLAAILGLIHIACDYATLDTFKLGSILRAIIFVIVASVTSYFALRQERLLDLQRESERRLSSIFGNAVEGIFQTTPDGRLLSANPALAGIFGYESPEELMASVTDIGGQLYVRKEDREAFIRMLGERGDLKGFEAPMRRKDGRLFWVSINVRVTRDDAGRPVRYDGFMMDITGRKRADDLLQESKEKYQSLVENISDVIYEIDNQGVVVYISPVVRDIMEYDQSDLVGKNFIEFVHEDDRRNLIERFFELREGIEYPSEYRLISKSGNIRWVRTRTNPIMLDGSFKGARGTIIDITDRKLAEKALGESEERFRTIFENSSSAMAIVERDTTISMVNREYCKIGLFEEKDIIGKSWTTQIPPGDRERLKEYNRQRLIDPKSVPDHYEFTFYRKDGKIRHSLMSIAMIPTSQKIVCSFVDITERKQMEEALEEERRRLQQALDEVRTLRGIVPICANCKKIRDDQGFWNQVEVYVRDHTEAEFSHGICPDCLDRLYPE